MFLNNSFLTKLQETYIVVKYQGRILSDLEVNLIRTTQMPHTLISSEATANTLHPLLTDTINIVMH